MCVCFFSFIFFFFFFLPTAARRTVAGVWVCVCVCVENHGKPRGGFVRFYIPGNAKKKKQKLCEPAAPTHPPQFFPQLLLTGVWVCGSPPFRYHDKTTTTMSLICFVSSKASAPKYIDVQQAVFKKCVQIGSLVVVGMAQSHCCHY